MRFQHAVAGFVVARSPKRYVVWLFLLAVIAFQADPALADGGADESEPVDLIEQALAIVVNAPGSRGEALERAEAVLAEDPSELAGLNLEALATARDALERGDDHAAEDNLVQALGQDPHPQQGSESAGANEPEDEEPGLLTTPILEHGLTERLEAGFRPPNAIALIAAIVIAGVGTLFLRHKGAQQ